MGKNRIEILSNEKYIDYFMTLINNNSLKAQEIVDIISKGKTIIYEQLKVLESERYILKNKNKEYCLNEGKLVEGFLLYCDKELKNKIFEPVKNEYKHNEYLIYVIKEELKENEYKTLSEMYNKLFKGLLNVNLEKDFEIGLHIDSLKKGEFDIKKFINYIIKQEKKKDKSSMLNDLLFLITTLQTSYFGSDHIYISKKIINCLEKKHNQDIEEYFKK